MKQSEINSLKNKLKNILDTKISVTNQSVFLDVKQIPKGKNVYNVEGSIMFVDIRNSTILSDSIGRKNMVKIYKMYTQLCKDAVTYYGGKILQIVGDGVLCAFTNDENMLSGEKAVSAAMKIHTYIEKAMNVLLDGGWKIGCGIGIRTGHVYVTRLIVGNDDQVAYPSDITNYASKLCREAKSGNVIFDSKTYEHLSRNLKDVTRSYQSDWGTFNIIEGRTWKIE